MSRHGPGGRRPSAGTYTPGVTDATPPADTLAAIRAWAVENGIPVSARGRISRDVHARYAAEH